MKTIYKYPLQLTDLQQIEIPAGAQLLTVQVQQDQPMLWAQVDPTSPTQMRTIRIVGTGNPVDVPMGTYIATVQMWSGRAVWHIFEA